MTLPVTPGSSISLSQVNQELGRASPYHQTIDMNDSSLRTLFGKVGSGTIIKMSDGSGKSSFTVLNPITGLSATFLSSDVPVGDYGYVYVNLYSDCTYDIQINAVSTVTGNWATPTTVGKGSLYWVKFTRTAFVALTGDASATANTGWLQLSSTRTVFCEAGLGGGGGTADITYRIEIASDSGGSTIVSTTNGLHLRVQAN